MKKNKKNPKLKLNKATVSKFEMIKIVGGQQNSFIISVDGNP